MYIAGVSGTGKSHVLQAIIKLFESLNQQNELLLGAPIGNAAILIGGHTLQSLSMLPNEKCTNFSELQKLWVPMQYLIINEMSMVSAYFMSQMSS